MANREAARRIAAMRERLAELRDRIQADPIFNPDLHAQIIEELQSALVVLETAQDTIVQQTDLAAEPTQSPQVEQPPEVPPPGELLLREMHHRIKNNLQLVASLLDLQVLRTENPEVRELLQNNQSRISLIALLHESLSQSQALVEVNFSEYVRSLALIVFRIYVINPDRIHLRLETPPEVSAHPDQAIPAGLILNELISNALKFGFQETSSGEVGVSLEVSSDAQITLRVSNSGDRLPADFDLNSTDSLGLQLVNSLVRQIDGTLTVSGDDYPSGTCEANRTVFTVTFQPYPD